MILSSRGTVDNVYTNVVNPNSFGHKKRDSLESLVFLGFLRLKEFSYFVSDSLKVLLNIF